MCSNLEGLKTRSLPIYSTKQYCCVSYGRVEWNGVTMGTEGSYDITIKLTMYSTRLFTNMNATLFRQIFGYVRMFFFKRLTREIFLIHAWNVDSSAQLWNCSSISVAKTKAWRHIANGLIHEPFAASSRTPMAALIVLIPPLVILILL